MCLTHTQKSQNQLILFFKIWEGLLFPDAKGAWREGQIPKEDVVGKRLRTTGAEGMPR